MAAVRLHFGRVDARIVLPLQAQLVLQEETGEGEMIDVAMYDQLLRMQERESRAIASLATKLRMTKQATVSEYAKKPYEGKKPWEC